MKLLFTSLIIYSCMLSGCKTSSQSNPKRSAHLHRSVTPADSLIKKQSSGIDFLAEGNDPASWILEMDFDKDFNFTSSDGIVLNVLAVKSMRLEAIADSYNVDTELGSIKIILYDKTCNGPRIASPRSMVEVTVKDKRYRGCGKFLYDHRVNDIWILEFIDNARLTAFDYPKGLPSIEFNLLKNKMYGYDGCNNINSTIEVQGNRIKFSPFNGTKMMCANDQAQNIFHEKLANKLVDYYLKDGKLILYLLNDSRLTFRKKE